jgi:peptidyl-tRNA hydrolase
MSGPAVASGTVSEPPEPLLQYVVLRKDLWKEKNWPLGSIVAQGCHAATAALWLSKDQPTTQTYCAPENIDHMHKVVLEATDEAQIRGIAQKLEEAGIIHKLWIEQPEDFVTCLATAPYPKSTVSIFMKKLKLCKGT